MEEPKKTTKQKNDKRLVKYIIALAIIFVVIGTITIISTNSNNWITTEIVKMNNDPMPTKEIKETNYCVVTVNLIDGTNVKYYVPSNPKIIICDFTGYLQKKNILYLNGSKITGLNTETVISLKEFGITEFQEIETTEQ